MHLVQMAEYRISIYGRKQSEWDQLASWIVNNELYSENVMWLIQVHAFAWGVFALGQARIVTLTRSYIGKDQKHAFMGL